MKLLFLSKYSRNGASSRLRSYQFLSVFRAAGDDVTIAPLFPPQYVNALYSKGALHCTVVLSYLRRAFCLFRKSRFDVVVIEKELFPWVPYFLERLFIGGRTRFVLDLDDALFHQYDAHRLFLVRFFLGRKIDRLMRRADLVTAGNAYLASRAVRAGAKKVEIVPTVVDHSKYPSRSHEIQPESLTVGWIGSPSTAHYLRILDGPLRVISQEFNVRFVAIGARPDQLTGSVFVSKEWVEDGEADALKEFDIGVMPLNDSAWERGKCGYKLIQYMATGVPFVASPVGVNVQLSDSGKCGLLASSSEDWVSAIRLLLADCRLRGLMGAAGRKKVQDVYSLSVQARVLRELYSEVNSASA